MDRLDKPWIPFMVYLRRTCSLEKETATHSSILAWETPWTEEPGGLQRVGHNWTTKQQKLN